MIQMLNQLVQSCASQMPLQSVRGEPFDWAQDRLVEPMNETH